MLIQAVPCACVLCTRQLATTIGKHITRYGVGKRLLSCWKVSVTPKIAVPETHEQPSTRLPSNIRTGDVFYIKPREGGGWQGGPVAAAVHQCIADKVK